HIRRVVDIGHGRGECRIPTWNAREWIAAWITLPGIVKTTGRIAQRDDGAVRSTCGRAVVRPHWREIVRDAVGRANGHSAVALWVPSQSHSRGEVHQVVICIFVTRNSGIAGE